MARIPPLRRLTGEDYQSQITWINPLLYQLNSFMEQTVAALSQGLTIADNMSGAIITAQLDGTFPLKIRWTLPARPVSVLVGNTTRADGTAFTLTSAVQVQWSFNQSGQLQIDGVVGIAPTAAAKYNLVLECKTG